VTLFAIAVAVGLAAGYARGGRLGHLGQLRLRAPVLAGLALAVQAGAGLFPPASRFMLVALGYALVGVWLVVNARARGLTLRVGIGLLALGWLLNGLAIATNGGMPVSADALERAGVPSSTDVADGHLYKHVTGNRGTPNDWLGDVIPVRPLAAVISLGDLALLAGIAVCLGGVMASPGEAGGQLRPSLTTVQEPGNDIGGSPRHRRRHRVWREPAPPGDDGGATIFDPHVALAACGITFTAEERS
jgi:hypothetical protein